jgi:hypothetical protein
MCSFRFTNVIVSYTRMRTNCCHLAASERRSRTDQWSVWDLASRSDQFAFSAACTSVVCRKLYVLPETSNVVLDTAAVHAVMAAPWKYE